MGGVSGLPRWLSGKESACQYRRHEFDPWVGKDPLEKEMETHSNILACEIPWTEESGELRSRGSQASDTTEYACMYTHTHTHTRTWDTRGTGSTGPFPLLGGFPEAFHELSNLCVPKYLILKLLYTTHHSHSARLFSASTRLSSPRAGTALSHCPAQSVTAPVQQGHTHTGFF